MASPQQEFEKRREGQRAAFRGHLPIDCPYKKGDWRYREWMVGWRDYDEWQNPRSLRAMHELKQDFAAADKPKERT